MLLPIYLWFEIIALIISLLFFYRFKENKLKYFVPFLFFIVGYEFADYNNWFTIRNTNHWAINFITTIEFLFYGLFIRATLINRRLRNISLTAIVFILALTILNIVFIQGFWRLHSYTFVLGALVLIFLSCSFFYELLNIDIETGSVLKYPLFWIVTGVLFFYLGQFTFFSFFEYMAYTKDYSYFKLFRFISNFSNAILYTCLSIGFACTSHLTMRS